MSTLAYGSAALALPDPLSGWPRLVGEEPPPLPDPAAAIDGALRRPDGTPALATFLEPGDRVAVVIQRELPRSAVERCQAALRQILEEVGCSEVRWLRAGGQTNLLGGWSQIVAAAGEAPPSEEDQGYESIGAIRGLGRLRIAAPLHLADKLILVGLGSLDPIAGHGGGAQLAARGCADPAGAGALLRYGIVEGPDAFQEVMGEILDQLPPSFLLQLELQRGDRLAAVFAGDPRRVLVASSTFWRKWRVAPIQSPFPWVVASAGGAPADRDLSAALPAFHAAASALDPGGTLLFAAACPEGLGPLGISSQPAPLRSGDAAPTKFSAPKPSEKASPPLAAILRRILGSRRCVLVSDGISQAEASALGLALARDLDAAVELARGGENPPARGAILEGHRVIPALI